MGSGRLKPGWTLVAFGDMVRQVKDRVDPTAAGLERYVAGEHMDTDDLHIRRWGTVGNGYLGPAFHARFRPGHVLYGSRRTYLRKVAVADFDGVTANTTFVIEARDPNVLLPTLLPFIMQTEAFHGYSIEKSKGSVNPYVNFSDIAAYEFALPPLNEQRRIAEAAISAGALSEALLNLLAAAVTTHAAMLTSLESSAECKPVRLGSLLREIVPGRSVAGSDKPPAASDYGVLKVSAVDPHGFLPYESKTSPVGASIERRPLPTDTTSPAHSRRLCVRSSCVRRNWLPRRYERQASKRGARRGRRRWLASACTELHRCR